jgi:hypothetical protein
MKFIKVCVYEDGDIELKSYETRPEHTMDLIFTPDEIASGALDAELIYYGCEADRARQAIKECLLAQPGEEIIV